MHMISLLVLTIATVLFAAVWRKNIVEWLVCACAEAEMTYGAGTGYLKLRDVYNEFVKTHSFVASILPFDAFSALVDMALKLLKEKLAENEAINDIITK